MKFTKIHLLRTELFHVDGRTDCWKDEQTDITKLVVALGSFSKRLKISSCHQNMERKTFFTDFRFSQGVGGGEVLRTESSQKRKMDVYMYMYIYIYIHTHIYTYINIYIYMCVCVCVYIYIYIYIYGGAGLALSI